jgi:hypothetical protein
MSTKRWEGAERRLREAREEIEEELRRLHVERTHAVKFHAYYLPERDGFACGFAGTKYGSKECESRIYNPVEIVEHLRRVHDISHEYQVIKGWNNRFEKILKRTEKSSS